ncbi:hypothetical protein CKM354_001008500 [Cercospora kikuchii]|uniref:F-box domain-containing protein n=1 Tax=Cercospora kikuchii TaxID=84275 RepID=A0A9P3FGT2_9PEZI|nr:uncharacterized protein CKM354_001008500 [Cercospora kikuchii]GIZ46983.1 hypothetical protein CKM354_001008500 [Cercospora kikuchii]
MMEYKTESQRKGCSSLLFAYGLLIWQVMFGVSRPLLPTEGDETRHICSVIRKNVLAMLKLVRSAIFRVWKPSDATIRQRDLPFDAPQTTPILDLPVELQLHILACLPLKQTQKCRLINRHFRELIDLEEHQLTLTRPRTASHIQALSNFIDKHCYFFIDDDASRTHPAANYDFDRAVANPNLSLPSTATNFLLHRGITSPGVDMFRTRGHRSPGLDNEWMFRQYMAWADFYLARRHFEKGDMRTKGDTQNLASRIWNAGERELIRRARGGWCGSGDTDAALTKDEGRQSSDAEDVNEQDDNPLRCMTIYDDDPRADPDYPEFEILDRLASVNAWDEDSLERVRGGVEVFCQEFGVPMLPEGAPFTYFARTEDVAKRVREVVFDEKEMGFLERAWLVKQVFVF